jgi:hypothetical protein
MPIRQDTHQFLEKEKERKEKKKTGHTSIWHGTCLELEHGQLPLPRRCNLQVGTGTRRPVCEAAIIGVQSTIMECSTRGTGRLVLIYCERKILADW